MSPSGSVPKGASRRGQQRTLSKVSIILKNICGSKILFRIHETDPHWFPLLSLALFWLYLRSGCLHPDPKKGVQAGCGTRELWKGVSIILIKYIFRSNIVQKRIVLVPLARSALFWLYRGSGCFHPVSRNEYKPAAVIAGLSSENRYGSVSRIRSNPLSEYIFARIVLTFS